MIPRPSLKNFPDSIVIEAVLSAMLDGFPASITLAQWAIESAYGTSALAAYFNFFGLKAYAGQPYVEMPTTEYVNGVLTHTTARFRRFTSTAEALTAHAQHLLTDSHYAALLPLLGDPVAYAKQLGGIYSTDPRYGDHVAAVMLQNGLGVVDDYVRALVADGAVSDGPERG